MKKNYLSNKYFILAKSFLYGMGTFVLVGFLLSLPMMLKKSLANCEAFFDYYF